MMVTLALAATVTILECDQTDVITEANTLNVRQDAEKSKLEKASTSSSSQFDVGTSTTKIIEADIDPHLFNRKRPIRIVSCSNELMSMDKLVLTKTQIPPTSLLLHVPRNSSSPVSQTALKGWRRLASAKPMTLYLIILACMSKSSIEDSDASVRAL
uniref:Secreted protein n=1 Tax=Angiostrongylus cantonensis TaxID=6313 RepID=A0A0K0CYR4_ANGCA